MSILLLLVVIAVSLACQQLSRETPTPYPTYTPYPTFTPLPAAEVTRAQTFNFAITKSIYAETDDIENACANALGPGWRTADWNDIREFVESGTPVSDFVSRLGNFSQLWVTYNGENWYSEQRRFFIETHEGQLPDGWLSHADIGEHFLDLGSWYDYNLSVLCFQSDEPAAIIESLNEPGEEEDSREAPQTPETPPTFALSYVGTQSCGDWPHFAIFKAESTSIWILQSAHFEIQDTTNNKSVYNGRNDRPFVKEGGCPPGETILPPFNTRFLAANIHNPAEGTEFSAAITLCTEESVKGECVTEIVDFVFGSDEHVVAPAGEGELPFVGVWQNPATGALLEFTENAFLNKFAFQGGTRKIYYTITAYNVDEGNMDLFTDRVLQNGEDVEFDWEPGQYLAYTIQGNEMKMFIGPNPYPNAAAGVTYIRHESEGEESDDALAENPAFELEFAGTHPCSNNPTYAAFWVKNISQHTFESVSLKIQDITHDQSMYGGSNDRGFVAEGGCPPGDSTLPPGEKMQVAAIMRNPDEDAEFEATIKLCTADGIEGDCTSQKVKFTIGE